MPSAEPRLSIRPATPDERTAITGLWARCGLTVAYNDPATDFDFAHDKPNSTVLVGLAGNRIVASVMVGHDGHRGWVWYVSVDPDTQGNGHGAEMVAAAESWLRSLGVRKVMLLIRDTNTRVRSFYEHLGYEAVPRVVMQKWLDQPD